MIKEYDKIRIFCFLLIALFLSCETQDKEYLERRQEQDALKYNPDWTQTTHGNGEPLYQVVFPQDVVNRIEITMTAGQWKAIRANMTSLTGFDFGVKQTSGGRTTGEPDYQNVGVRFLDKQWKDVGFRLKGNSSLRAIWGI